MVPVGPTEQVSQRRSDVLCAHDERVAVAVDVAGQASRQVGEGSFVVEPVADRGWSASRAQPFGRGVGHDPPLAPPSRNSGYDRPVRQLLDAAGRNAEGWGMSVSPATGPRTSSSSETPKPRKASTANGQNCPPLPL